MDPETKRRTALLAAVSALGLSLGVTVPACAADTPADPNKVKLERKAGKGQQEFVPAAAQAKGESRQIKLQGSDQFEWIKTESKQIKMQGQQIKVESRQLKQESPQAKTSNPQ